MEVQQSLFDNIIFVGGIHGVGKSTMCLRLAEDLDFKYLSASDVLKWHEINTDIKNKRVKDIPNTQDRLITGLNNIISSGRYYILDGHFCLFNNEGIATRIPLATFFAINPQYLIVVTGNTLEILNSLKIRDKKTYSQESLIHMQELEVEYASEISKQLDIPLFVFDKNEYNLNYEKILSQLHESLT